MITQNNKKNLKETSSDQLIIQAERMISEKAVSDKMAEDILKNLEIAIINERIKELEIETILLSMALGETDSDYIKTLRKEHNI